VLTAALASAPFGPESLLWRRYKTTERQVYNQAKVPGVDQTIHYNERGELTESTSMTLVLEKDGRFLTPALGSGLLDGTYRAHLVARGQVTEAVLPVEALAQADKVWLINSVRRWKAASVSVILP
jgi:para-aminobenzoate synthetase/4-amino-4-deoxychorismate lyase